MQNTHLILAKKILNTMSALNVKEFNQMYANRSKDELIQFMIETIDGLLEEEIQYGISRLCKEQKLVNFGGFRKLCESAGVWQSPIEAWEDVLNYEKNIVLVSNCGKENEEIYYDLEKVEEVPYFSTLIFKKGGFYE